MANVDILRNLNTHDIPPEMTEVCDKNTVQFLDKVNDLNSWTFNHPEMWSTDDIINWIYSTAFALEMNLETLCGERFQDVTGQQLCQFSVEDFVARDRLNGTRLYYCLQELLRQSQFVPPADFNDIDECFDDIESLCALNTLHKLGLEKLEPANSPQPTPRIPSFSVFLDPLQGGLPLDEISLLDDIPPFPISYWVDLDQRNAVQDSGYESAGSYSENSNRSFLCHSPVLDVSSSLDPTSACKELPTSLTDSRSRLGQPEWGRFGQSMIAEAGIDRPQKRKPGRPPKRTISSSSTSYLSSSDESYSPTQSKKSKKKNPHLWKFMRALLEDPAYNPHSIKWENKKEGVFRIVPGQSKFIAKLWGQRKNNPSMTFDKMSRSLRWCRTYGFLSEVPKDGNYPKKLCFRFGERAANWQM